MQNTTEFKTGAKFDVICLGRAGVDLYAEQIGSPLEDVRSFRKYIGGSSTNIAFGAARLGLRSSMLTRVGDEHMGRFIKKTLAQENCDVEHVVTDPERITAFVILGIKDKDTFPLIFVRENCADMAIDTTDFDEDYIASSKSLVITGTHFSTAQTKRVSLKALEYARKNNTRTVLDIDYRPVLWGLTNKGDGETRFIQSENVTEHLLSIAPHFDLIVGTEEEFFIAGGSTDILSCLKKLRKVTTAVFVVKRGSIGCSVIKGVIPDTLDDATTVQGVQVEVLNVLGAGDAFISGFLKGWLNSEDYVKCCEYANACGALVVSRHACSPSMPTKIELSYYMEHQNEIARPDIDPVLNRLHLKTLQKKKWQDLAILAFDHRKQMKEICDATNSEHSVIPHLKSIIYEAFQKVTPPSGISTGVLLDDTYGQDNLNDLTGNDFWIARPVELPGSYPIEFEGEMSIGSRLASWPTEHIIKCLVFYHPLDSEELKKAQLDKVLSLYNSCASTGHELLLEIILPPQQDKNGKYIADSVREFYEYGIYPDWWKLEPQSKETWQELERLIISNDPHCRGIVILGLNKPIESFKQEFSSNKDCSLVKGFAIGRTVFYQPLLDYLEKKIDKDTCVRQIAANYEVLIDFWINR